MNTEGQMNKRLTTIPWWAWLMSVSILLIMMTALFSYVRHDFLRWIVVNHFNLAGEMTLAAWWSGVLLLLVVLLAYEMSGREGEPGHAWRILAALFVLLSFDEIGSLHERAGNTTAGTLGLLLAGIVGGSAFLYACWILWQQGRDRKGVVLLLLGGAVLASAAPQEFLEHRLDWPLFLQGARVAVEEGSELMGMLLCLAGLVRIRSSGDAGGPINRILPDPEHLLRAATGNLIPFGVHLGISVWVARYVAIEFRGNPAVFYFLATFFSLALAYCWQATSRPRVGNYANFSLACYFMALSVGSMYFVLPRFNSKLHDLGLLADLPVLLASQLVVLIVALSWLNGRLTRKEVSLFIALAIALGVGWIIDSTLANYVVSGLFALVIANLFWPRSGAVLPA